MNVHILGIEDPFMRGIALLARELGYRVTGSAKDPAWRTTESCLGAGIAIWEAPLADLPDIPDVVLVGSEYQRGDPEVETVLDQGWLYRSGPAWLRETVLPKRQVLAISGTHGKTMVSSMLAWILMQAGMEPGFLIGDVPLNFGTTASLGTGTPFVVEADECYTAFFDTRAAFTHYRPNVLILNNLEYDHAEQFTDLSALEAPYLQVLKVVPRHGTVVFNADDPRLDKVLQQGCLSQQVSFGLNRGAWRAEILSASAFLLYPPDLAPLRIEWSLLGQYNVLNALAAAAAAVSVGVLPEQLPAAFKSFMSVQRRMERIYHVGGLEIYHDFAHHPTEIAASIQALRSHAPQQRIMVCLDLADHTMKLGVHQHALGVVLEGADRVLLHAPPDTQWDTRIVTSRHPKATAYTQISELCAAACAELQSSDQVILMSNGDFGGLATVLLNTLGDR